MIADKYKNFNKFAPLVVNYGFYDNQEANFIILGKLIKITNIKIELLQSLLKLCTGYFKYGQILKKMQALGYKTMEVKKIMHLLIRNSIVVDSREYYSLYHAASKNPLIYWGEIKDKNLLKLLKSKSYLFSFRTSNRSYFERLLEKRASERIFSQKKISKREILRLIWAIYGKTNRSKLFKNSNIGVGTVPSAGGLYPLRIYIIQIQKSNSVKSGLYKVSQDGIIFLKKINISNLKNIFIGFQENILNASLIIVISGDFRHTSQKYSNRGYRYALLEAGHAAQNAYLWCSEQNFGIVEIGSFNDEDLSKLIGVDYPYEAPITSLIIGKK